MNVAMIGRGRVATHMGKALLKAGHGVVSVNSRTLEELPQDADVYIIAVKDSALQEVIQQLTKRLTADTPSLWRGLFFCTPQARCR